MVEQNRNLENIKKIILVSAGKGGVGKSTIATLLAMQLQNSGKNVGILDADIYGPSIPTILDIEDEVPNTENNLFTPIISNGIKTNSIGYLVKPESALAWRGPMLTKALNQLLFSTNWGELDYLIVDMPPGTGDIHLSFAKMCKIDASVIVTTPDKIAQSDVQRAVDLYNKLNIPVAGIIENMSYLLHNGEKMNVFGQGASSRIAQKNKINIIAKLPLIPSLAENKELYNSDNLKIDLSFLSF